MAKIVILGSSGTGKKTLCRRISEKLNIPQLHLDNIYWKKNWDHIDKESFDQYMKEYLKKHKDWVIDGNYSNNKHFYYRLALADIIVFLDYGTSLALRGIHERARKYKHRTRSDMAEGCVEGIDQVFLQYVAFYEPRAQKLKAIIKTYAKHKKVVVFKDRTEMNKWFNDL